MNSIYSVGQVNNYIKNMFTQDFMLSRISVKGEVSNCKYHTSGHIYFSLKDEEEIPTKVSINEAVELAKRFGGEDSFAFVNGILGRVAKELR